MRYDYVECGDCIQLMKNIDDKSIDIVLTSPPYNMTKRKGGYADTGRYDEYVDWKTEEDYIDMIKTTFTEFDRLLKNNGVILFNFSYSIENPSLPYKLVSSIVADTNFELVDTILWHKKSGIPFPANKQRLCRIWEYVFVFVRKDEINTFNINKKVKSISEKTGQKYYEVFYNYIDAKNNDGKCSLNQATFSSDLVVQLLNMYSVSDDDIVLDCYAGTGTTAIGCIKCNKHYICLELSKDQCDYAIKRINELE